LRFLRCFFAVRCYFFAPPDYTYKPHASSPNVDEK
jgi:hypothetical protein